MNYEIPLNNVPNQKISVMLGGQDVVIYLREFEGRQHISVSQGGVPICYNVLLADRIPVIKYGYFDFVGDFCSVDMIGDEIPNHKEWNTRFKLIYSDTGFTDD